jgi:hypothetical protein
MVISGRRGTDLVLSGNEGARVAVSVVVKVIVVKRM